ncbi:MAG: SCP2 sterol-binding domain-containing protein [Ilumatobacteraceae bacterium]
MPHPFLSPAWMEAAKAIREKYADQATKVTSVIRMNQVITGVPDDVYHESTIRTYLDTSSGTAELELGQLETADATITTDYETARMLFVAPDPAAGMQAFMSGKIKVQGDMMKMMALQTAMPQDDTAKTIAQEIQDITS